MTAGMGLPLTRARARILLCTFAAAAAPTAGAVAADAASFARCPGETGDAGVQCASVVVPLDRTSGTSDSVALHVERIPARGFAARPPLLALAGGPGQSASAFTAAFAASLRGALASRDLIVVDQRGTGLSGALRCPSFERVIDTEAKLADAMTVCAGGLGAHLAHYRTLDSVEDLDAVRAAVGAERVALFGVSYGTKVALAYAARHPERVDRLVLDSVVRPDGPDVLLRSSFAAVPRVLRAVCARDCPFTTDPAADLAALVRRLRARSLQGTIVGPNGRSYRAALSGPDLFSLLLAGDFDARLRAGLPAAISAAATGDPAQVLRLLSDAYRSSPKETPRLFSTPLYYATTCSDSPLPWQAADPPEQRSAALRAQVDAVDPSAFAPFDGDTALAVGIGAICRYWPSGGTPATGVGTLPDVPALLLSGALDLRTPVADAAAVAALLPHAQLLAVGGVGHSVVIGGPACATRAAVAFLDGGAAPARACSVPSWLVPDRPAPRTLAAVGGRPRARLAAAGRLTLDDVLRRLPTSTGRADARRFALRGGGLRGGRYTARPGSLALDRVVLVPGVTVSGTIRGDVDPWLGLVDHPRGTLVVRRGTAVVRVRVAASVLG